MYESKNSVYCYKGTNVLVNKMNIKDPIALKANKALQENLMYHTL